MDYNLDLIGQVIKGYRVMGSGTAGSLDLINDTGGLKKPGDFFKSTPTMSKSYLETATKNYMLMKLFTEKRWV